MLETIPLILFEEIWRSLEPAEVDGNFKSLRSAVAQLLLAGAAGIYVTGGYISDSNRMVFTLSNGNTIDFGTIALGEQVHADALITADYAASAATSKAHAETAATTATQKAAAAAASAETARAIVGVPPAFDSLVMQPNRIDTDMTIPAGFNIVLPGPMEQSHDVTITVEGNACAICI